MVRIDCKGYDPTPSGPDRIKIGHRCRFCGKHGHYGKDCEQNNLIDSAIFSGYTPRCPVCKCSDSGCHKRPGNDGFNCLKNPNPTPAELKSLHLNKRADSAQNNLQSTSKNSEPKSSSLFELNLDSNNPWHIKSSKARENAKKARSSFPPSQTTDSVVPPVVDKAPIVSENECINIDVEKVDNDEFDLNLISKRSPRKNVINLNPVTNLDTSRMSDGLGNNVSNRSLFDFDNPIEDDSSSGPDTMSKSLAQLNKAHEKLSRVLDDSDNFDPDY